MRCRSRRLPALCGPGGSSRRGWLRACPRGQVEPTRSSARVIFGARRQVATFRNPEIELKNCFAEFCEVADCRRSLPRRLPRLRSRAKYPSCSKLRPRARARKADRAGSEGGRHRALRSACAAGRSLTWDDKAPGPTGLTPASRECSSASTDPGGAHVLSPGHEQSTSSAWALLGDPCDASLEPIA